jgi:CBS domain containing-hemolysin-like protein
LDDPSPLLYVAILLLLVLSAFFSCSETAISTVNKLRLKKSADEGSRGAKTAYQLSENYDKTLFTILIGNNIVNIVAAVLATVLLTALLGRLGSLAAAVIMTVLVLTFGEILPKSYGSANSEKMSILFSRPLRVAAALLAPFSWAFRKLIRIAIKPAEASPTVTEDELIHMLGDIEEEGVIEAQERHLVQSALEFDEVTIGEIIPPRVDIAALDVKASPEEVKELLLDEGYSRIPVYEDSVDNIIGILIARDYLRCLLTGEPAELVEMLAEPMFVHRTMKLSQLLAKLRATKTHLAVVTDDYGGTFGIVTMEDLLEELVGEIWDEDDDVQLGIVHIAEDCWEVQGSYDAGDMLEQLGEEKYEIPDNDYNTVNGWAGHIYGHIPAVGDVVTYKDLELTVLEMDGHRIQYLRILRVPEAESTEKGED